MAVYLISWNLNKEGAAYSQARAKLIEGISKFDNKHRSDLDSVRFISSTSTANEIYATLKRLAGLDDNDLLLVTRIVGTSNQNNDGNLGPILWSWINARV